MRTLVTAVAILAALWLLAAPRAAPPPAAPDRGEAADWTEALEWRVLCPRGRGSSPAPIVAFATPGWLGPVEVTIETRERSTVVTTANRTLPWPVDLGVLAVGDWCAVTVSGPLGKAASTAFLRCAPVPEFPHSATMSRARGR
jgi:hypothetical protein